MSVRYHTEGESFLIDQYNAAPPFSSFFPALAGLTGKPMWVFTTNRGQAIASFGVNDKNGAMLEFQPANKAYQQTPLLGFRTFIKHQNKSGSYYEPFSSQEMVSHQTMITRPYELELKDRNSKMGIETHVLYFGIPEENVPALARSVTFKNISNRSISLQIADGLPRIVPWGMNDFLVKNMSRTIEAFAEVLNLKNNVPIFKLKIVPDDRPDISWLNEGFFSFCFSGEELLPVIVDPQAIFGQDTSFLKPNIFIDKKVLTGKGQLTSNIMPSSFFYGNITLKPHESKTWNCFYGYAHDISTAQEFSEKVRTNAKFLSTKREKKKEIFKDLTAHMGFKSGNDQLNAYTNVTFMDNVLRGGFPMLFSPKGPFVHVFSRKHGDMERDYNNFQVSATYYSQGNGNFRDVNQNRRSDLMLNPQLGTENLEFFFNLLQLDGYNPLVINPIRFSVPADLLHRLELQVTAECHAKFDRLKRKPILAGQLYEFVKTYAPDPLNVDNVFREAISLCQAEHKVQHGEGYWVDHWIYNLDHLDQYIAVFPDKKTWLFFEKKDFTFHDSDHFVRSRREKYVVTKDGHLRQYGAVQRRADKRALVRSRRRDNTLVRTEMGRGPVFYTTLFVKLLNLVVVKASTLDPFGVGIEMEADKPGWCDALNGAPGLFGSSTHEMFELQRLVQMLIEEVLPLSPHRTIEVPHEIYAMMKEVGSSLSHSKENDFRPTWDRLVTAREAFREKTFLGLSGKLRAARVEDMRAFFQQVLKILYRAGAQAIDPKTNLPTSYFTYSVDMKSLDDGWRQHLAKLPWKQHRVPSFLEGSVHAMKVMSPARAKKLYQNVKKSGLADKKVGMYKLNVSLADESAELGRINAFSPGWLENESIFLHMHYKYLLEILRSGFVDLFIKEMPTGLIPFRDPKTYGRPNFENSSFLASSSFPNPDFHGRGFVARLSGATSEYISMLYLMFFGQKFFKQTENGVIFSPEPKLPKDWFSKNESLELDKNCISMKLFGVPITYQNPKKRNTFGAGSVKPVEYEWISEGRFHNHKGRTLPEEPSERLREGKLENLNILLG